jgi:hypothetical protein
MSGWLMLRAVERQAKQIDTIEAERREAERREAERRQAERREAERRETERREAEARAASVPAALPAPIILDETLPGQPRQVRPRPATPQLRPPPAADRAPALPPPLNIGPSPGASGKSGQAPRPAGEAAVRGAPPPASPPPAPRSALESLFGVQR